MPLNDKKAWLDNHGNLDCDRSAFQDEYYCYWSPCAQPRAYDSILRYHYNDSIVRYRYTSDEAISAVYDSVVKELYSRCK